MIKNIVFDMGRVLINFDQPTFFERVGVAQEDRQLIFEEVYASVEWVQLDRGLLDEEDALEIWYKRVPERLHDQLRVLVTAWEQPLMPVEGMAELVRELKEAGYGIFLISNASHRQHEYWPGIPGSEYFDDTLISADVHINKPEPEIFKEAYRKFDILPEESVFIDDFPPNCEASILTGMDAFIFRMNVGALRKWLQGKGVRVNA
ncbi:MAG: HAD family phosphatase [Lachnospiraceae bacterium]|nr:HAD family phosphatase [Lachnospiraceae bacterium]